jgi:ion channel POLLUX/CASTOR
MKHTFNQKFRYRFDNFLSKGTIALIIGLFVIVGVVVVIAAVFVTILAVKPFDTEGLGFLEAVYQSFLRTLDPGTMGDDEGWSFRFIMLFVTLVGVFVLSALISVLNSGLDNKLTQLRKGKSKVIEKNHTVILGWSPKIFTIISELIEANSNYKNMCVVVLGDKDKMEMEEEIKHNISSFRTTRVVCRSGKSVVLKDLEMLSIDQARSIIVLAPDKNDPDAEVIKTVLAIVNKPRQTNKKFHIVAEIEDIKNANICKMVGKDEIEIVQSCDIISKIIAQTCRQSGLSQVYMELLVYEGDELYFQEQPELHGKTYKEMLFAYEDSSLFGIKTNSGKTFINPPMDTVFEQGGKVICISEDDDTVILNGKQFEIDESVFSSDKYEKIIQEDTLILGWNKKGKNIIKELDAYIVPDSVITIVANIPNIENIIQQELPKLKRAKVAVIEKDTTQRNVLESIGVENKAHIIIISYSDNFSQEDADSLSLITLLHLRDIAEKREIKLSIVSEMLIDENRTLAEVTNADDFIVSDKVISLLLTQISEQKELSEVFGDIFQPEGSEIYIKPITDYVKPNTETDFYNVVEAAARKNETAIGYRIMEFEKDVSKSYGLIINPAKSNKLSFSSNDKLIVLAIE